MSDAGSNHGTLRDNDGAMTNDGGSADEWHLALFAADGDPGSREKAKRMFEDLVAHFDVHRL